MARKKATETIEIEDQVEDPEEVEDVEDPEEIDEFESENDELSVLDGDPSVETDDDESDDLDDGAEESDPAALDELEAAELSMLTPDEAAEVIRVDEAAEVASLRRAELALDKEADSITVGEFVCSSCFLVKKNTQLASKRKQICNDCAA